MAVQQLLENLRLRTSLHPPLTPLGLEGTHNRSFPRPTLSQLAETWREVQGADDWKGMLEPLNDHLRAELIRYGELAQVSYDSFDYDKHSKFCGSCRYSPDSLFEEVDLHHTGYTVTWYIYATANVRVWSFLRRSEREDAWSKKSNWIGYVAVCTDEKEINRLGRRDILVVWRGTVTGLEWAANAQYFLVPCAFIDGGNDNESTPKVEAGFLSLYTSADDSSRFNKISAREYAVKEIVRLIEEYKDDGHELSITICGHSLGSGLGLLFAYDVANSKLNQISQERTIPITVFSFGGPRVGDGVFKQRVEDLGIKVLRVVNKGDIVPHVPGTHLLESFKSAYHHLGVEFLLDDQQSLHLNQSKGRHFSVENLIELSLERQLSAFAVHHNLEVYLHLIDGYGRYDKPPTRDPVLVNKGCGFLKENKYVPECWWQVENKGLRYCEYQNRYFQPERAYKDRPVPPEQEVVDASKALSKSLSLHNSKS
ncbi:phospholipase A1-Igamma3, chloroplastic [Physcomitrium patens]|uniref:Fungal lipase-type domain-containing protein n=1 Tax=Physcomitrium patens TaxID=3218 RepID=A0A2K1ILQ2_PHYPA|nr:phospholipase A1-Igamma3, chloroplastic-like [Physcomitrium patens]PNR30204.1 hypothetical protein PHYPA_026520 [Physcomitrium patens]|eukprot:XP_024360416.1 phospholipase A1-Igamma3, chloroplastic-like [Physcomitrella patens]